MGMNKEVAEEVGRLTVEPLRDLPYEELARRARERQVDVVEVRGRDGVDYQVEVLYVWDHNPDGPVRVMAAVDDGGIRAFFPMAAGDFIKSKSGEFIGE